MSSKKTGKKQNTGAGASRHVPVHGSNVFSCLQRFLQAAESDGCSRANPMFLRADIAFVHFLLYTSVLMYRICVCSKPFDFSVSGFSMGSKPSDEAEDLQVQDCMVICVGE
jgi:hypothetical protein